MARHACVICGTTTRVRLWTIDNLNKVVGAYLCREDAAPLWKIMDAVGCPQLHTKLPRPSGPPVATKRHRDVPMTPLLNWTPPTEAPERPAPMPPELTDLDLIVIDFRKDGMSWEAVGKALDISRQAAYQRFRHLPGVNGEE
jgi:hypothetical protein